MDVLARARRRMIVKLVFLALLFVGPAIAGYFWGRDAFLAAAFGGPALGLGVWALLGGDDGGPPRNWPRA